MGTVKVTNIEPIADNGTLTIGNSGDTITLTSGAKTSGFGKIGQVVTYDKQTSVSVSGSTSTNIDSGITITPTTSTSKILLIWTGYIENSGSNNGHYSQIIMRNGTTNLTYITDAFGYRIDQGARMNWSGTYVDSPASTSEQTYNLYHNNISGSSKTYVYYRRQYQLLEILD